MDEPPGLQIVPISLRAANAFVAEHHRHNKPARGHKFSVGVESGGVLVGVAIVGRPIARALDDGRTAEVLRTCTVGERNANSKLYGACWQAARAMGYERIVTYTQEGETGASLRAAGFVVSEKLAARKGWRESSVKLKGIRDPNGNGGVERVRWEIARGKP